MHERPEQGGIRAIHRDRLFGCRDAGGELENGLTLVTSNVTAKNSLDMKLGCLSGVALVDSGRGEVDDRIVHRHAG